MQALPGEGKGKGKISTTTRWRLQMLSQSMYVPLPDHWVQKDYLGVSEMTARYKKTLTNKMERLRRENTNIDFRIATLFQITRMLKTSCHHQQVKYLKFLEAKKFILSSPDTAHLVFFVAPILLPLFLIQ